LPDRLRAAFLPDGRGVVGVVSELLALCSEQGLRLEWHAGHCRVCPLTNGQEVPTDVSLPRSAFRAILARVAALCNERSPGSVSPYGGEGEIGLGDDVPGLVQVRFTNTPAEQRLEMRCARTGCNGSPAAVAAADLAARQAEEGKKSAVS
jgi:hypothetical protein